VGVCVWCVCISQSGKNWELISHPFSSLFKSLLVHTDYRHTGVCVGMGVRLWSLVVVVALIWWYMLLSWPTILTIHNWCWALPDTGSLRHGFYVT